MVAGSIELAAAYISLLPSTERIAPAISKEVAKAEGDVARSGKKAGAAYSAGLGGAVGGAAKRVFAPLAAAAAGVSLVGFFGDAVRGASELEQSVGGVEAVFKAQAGAIKSAAQEAAQNLGLSKNAYQELATVLGAGLKSQGIKDYAKSTQDLIGIGADLAAQYGGSTKDAVDALASAMRGESDPIERYGISLNETAVNAELAARGQDKLKGAALQQAKAMARIAIITRQSADAQGAFARESDTLAGKQARMVASWENFKAVIGTALLPAMSQALDVMSGLGRGVVAMFDQLRSGDGAVGSLRSGFDQLRAAFAAIVGSPVGQWFVELARSVGGVLGPKLREIAGTVSGTLWPALRDIGGVLLSAGKAFAEFAATIINSPVGRFLTTLLKGVIVGFVKGVVDIFQGLVRVVSGVFQALAGLLSGDWSRMWSGLGQVVLGAVQAIWGFLQAGLMGRVLGVFRGFISATGTIFGGLGAVMSGLLRGLVSGFIEFGGTLGRIAGAVITPAVKAIGAVFGLLKGLADTAIGGVVKAFQALGSKITGALKLSDDAMRAFGTGVSAVWTAITGAISTAWTAIFGRVLTPMRTTIAGVLLTAWNAFSQTIQAVWSAVSGAVQRGWATVQAVFTVMRTWVASTLTGVWNAFRALVANVWTGITSSISAAWSAVLSRVFNPLRSWVSSTLTGMWNSFRQLVASVWSAIVSSISNAWSRVLSVFTTLRTWVTSTLTSAWNTLRTTTANAWSSVTTSIGNAWTKISGYFTNLKTGVNQVWDFFGKAVTGISKAWSGLTTAIQGPINSAKSWINTNLVGKMNSALSTVGVSLRVPGLASGGIWGGPGNVTRAASGTVIPGYTPGRDPHRFWSPTGGRLALSGGEAVMVPEWTRAVGPRLVKMMNRIARRGGVDAIRKFLWGSAEGKPGSAFARGGVYSPRGRRFADGGLLDALKGAAGATGDVIKSAAGKLEGIATSATALMSDPAGALSKLGSSILGMLPGRGQFPGAVVYGAMGKVVSGVVAKVKEAFSAMLGGGGFSRSGSWPPAVMGRVSPNTAAAVNFVRSTFGIRSIGTLGSRPNKSDHPMGKALDAMIPGWSGASGIALGNRIASWFVGNPGRFGTKYVIWRKMINSGGGWRGYRHPTGASNPTLDHMDHVHVSFLNKGGILGGRAKLFDGGGLLRRGDIAVHDAVKPDRVLTDAQWQAVMRHLPIPTHRDGGWAALQGGNAAGVHIHGDVYGDPDRFARKVTTRLHDELALVSLAGV